MRRPLSLIVLLMLGLLGAMAGKSLLSPLPSVRTVPGPSEFNVHRAATRLSEILGDQRPHPTDSDANDAVRERLLAHLTEIGFDPQVRDALACNEFVKSRGVGCARVRNVVVTIGPPAGKHVLLATHYDSTPVGPGAGDAGVGVATLIEVAEVLKDQPLKRPMTFLFDEGEELGLIGARAFLSADPIASQVDSLINLEARGVSGPVNMFETSRPNGPAIAAYARAVDTPVANSLSTDVYRLLPNSTDVNVFAERGWTTLNFAIIGNETRYHSAGDNVDALDQRSLQQMGDQTLALTRTLATGVPAANGERIFMDLIGTELVNFPLWVGLLLLAGLVIAFAWLAWRRRALGRALATVVATLVVSALVAWLAQAIVGVIRPGVFWRAYPLVAHLAAYATAIAAALTMLATLGRSLDAERLRTAFWLAFVLLGAGLALIAPGGIIYFLLPPLLMLIGIIGGRSAQGAERIAALAAVLLLFLTLGTMLGLLEELLSKGPIWLFAPLGVLILLPVLIEAKPRIEKLSSSEAIGAGAVLALVGWVATAAVPAYSADRQQHFTIAHFTDATTSRSFWSVVNDDAPLPAAFGKMGKWRFGKLPHSESERWLTAAPPAPGGFPPGVELVGRGEMPGARRVRVRLKPNGAQSIALIGQKDAAIRAAGTPGYIRPISREPADGRYVLRCSGRSCDGLILDIVIAKAAPVEFILASWRSGLPPAAAPLVRARPRHARPQYATDETIAMTRVRL